MPASVLSPALSQLRGQLEREVSLLRETLASASGAARAASVSREEAGVRLYADDGNERAHEAYKVRRPPRKIAFATVVGSNKRQQPRVAAQRMCGRAWLPAEPRCAPGC